MTPYEVVQFGLNPPALAIEGTVGAMSLITFMDVPQPASLMLLTVGAAICLHRGDSLGRG